ncbi:NACHT domain-containing protein [Lentzea sp. JNUCC 0626]|uniref:NACHT domain-containing protein n=1 Tax=Lentzea sp. JNUCC 0626 TaxID=3367513 RepID=UPI003747FA04
MATGVDLAQDPGGKGDLVAEVKRYWDYLTDPNTSWPVKIFVGLLVAGLVVTAGRAVTPFFHEVWNFLKWLAGRRLTSERRRRRKRRMFAEHVDNQLRHLELQEDWRDEKYAELEAEVEIEQTWGKRWMRRMLPFRRSSLRRVRSLSDALRRSSVRLVLLEGEPGAGKSIALRHLARVLAKRAAKSRKVDATIPLYINLKQLDLRPEQVSEAAIRTFVLATLNEVNSRDVQEVLDAEFDRGLEEGTWLFLFDSFDEIPDLLSAKDTRRVAPLYAQAIADFLGPFTRCRGIVASRDFTSPDLSQFTRFRILRLSQRQQHRLIRRADLDRSVDRALRSGLATASQDITTFASNPMFLGLLCEHMRTSGQFPANSHAVFEDYLNHRLQRDAQRIRSRFSIDVGFVRAGAEEIAFLMGSVPRMGLTPSRESLLASASTLDTLTPHWLGTVLDALEYSKLGRTDVNTVGKATFSFVHRRFQEYFATRVVIRAGDRVPVTSLLDNDQWRETAVTLLQIQGPRETTPLLTEAATRLSKCAFLAETGDFEWPDGCLHLLRILAAGLESCEDATRKPLQPLVDRILVRAWERGHRLDKRRALDFVPLASAAVAERLLTGAFRSRNELLREGAFRSAGSLPDLTPALRAQIRRMLLGLAASIDLYRKRASTVAQIKRLAHPAEFLTLLHLLTIAFPVAVVLATGGFAVSLGHVAVDDFSSPQTVGGSLVLAFVVGTSVMLVSAAFSLAALRRGGGRLVEAMSSSTLVEHKVLRAAGIAAALTVHAFYCFISVVFLAPINTTGIWINMALTVYAVLWPVAVIWSARTGLGSKAVLWPLLPVIMIVLGGLRSTRWLRHHRQVLKGKCTPKAGWQLLLAVGRLIRPSMHKIGYVVVGLAIIVAWAMALNQALTNLPVTTLILVVTGTTLLIILAFLMGSIPLRRDIVAAQNADDVLSLIAKLRTTSAFDTVIARLGVQRIARDPEAKQTIENLVGEIERAQVLAQDQPELLLRTACPSLAHQRPPRQWLLDSWPLGRWTTLRVTEVGEDTLDELARLADKD